ncbi:CopG family transcriptional regulator [Rhodococcus sp. T7]|uniref:ribbon-helix-helix domain-containing protein n=1 Tax=Rhodococcus sp. T7 TaxID=627444 RepID=UPI003FA6C665
MLAHPCDKCEVKEHTRLILDALDDSAAAAVRILDDSPLYDLFCGTAADTVEWWDEIFPLVEAYFVRMVSVYVAIQTVEHRPTLSCPTSTVLGACMLRILDALPQDCREEMHSAVPDDARQFRSTNLPGRHTAGVGWALKKLGFDILDRALPDDIERRVQFCERQRFSATGELRRLSAVRRAIPLVMLTLKLEPDTAQKFTALAAEYDTTVSALMRIALHRFLETPGRYKHPMLREAERTGLSDKVEVMVNPSSRQQIWRLAGRHGDKLGTALLRVALRRLLEKPGDLSADLENIAPVRDLRPEIFSARVNVHFDAPLRDRLDALAAQVGSDRAELMRLAAQRVLEAPGMIEQAVNREIFRGEKNRAHLMARHARRQARRRTQPD